MIEWLKVWANQVIVAVIIAVIFELIIPNGKNKKYIKTVINLYVLFVLINPIISKINGKNSLDLSKYDYNNYLTQKDSIQTSGKMNTEDIINSTVEKSIKDDMKNKLLLEGYNASNIRIEINNSGKINWIKLSVSINKDKGIEEGSNKNNIAISINKVEDININTNTRKENKKETLRKSEIEKIKKILSDEYNVSVENIEIN